MTSNELKHEAKKQEWSMSIRSRQELDLLTKVAIMYNKLRKLKTA